MKKILVDFSSLSKVPIIPVLRSYHKEIIEGRYTYRSLRGVGFVDVKGTIVGFGETSVEPTSSSCYLTGFNTRKL